MTFKMIKGANLEERFTSIDRLLFSIKAKAYARKERTIIPPVVVSTSLFGGAANEDHIMLSFIFPAKGKIIRSVAVGSSNGSINVSAVLKSGEGVGGIEFTLGGPGVKTLDREVPVDVGDVLVVKATSSEEIENVLLSMLYVIEEMKVMTKLLEEGNEGVSVQPE